MEKLNRGMSKHKGNKEHKNKMSVGNMPLETQVLRDETGRGKDCGEGSA